MSLSEFLDVLDVMKQFERLYSDSPIIWEKLRAFCNEKLYFEKIARSS